LNVDYYYVILGTQHGFGPAGRSAGPKKNAGHVKILNPLVRKSLVRRSSQFMWADPLVHIKKIAHVYFNYFFFLDFCMNVPNFCMTKKDKYYIFLNVIKFEEYIMYVKV